VEEFGTASLAQVLEEITLELGTDRLSDEQLEVAVQIWNLLSKNPSAVNSPRLRIPTTSMKMQPLQEVFFNDAPWMKADLATTVFVHAKISQLVADAHGVRKIRDFLLKESGDEGRMFEECDEEEFSQKEQLTTRLANLLNDYADGAGIIKELIQNADDAGARTFKFLMDYGNHPTQSLLGPEMVHFNGPSLYAYNDKPFKEGDFANICKLGGGGKKNSLDKIGKFGLGFNSVYHYTDLPSIVSGEYVVIFDPHGKYLPGNSNGKRFNFVQRRILDQFPDQFSPYCGIFGCDMKTKFEGTLFRFPLRTEFLATVSEIMPVAYTFESAKEMLKGTYELADSLMLFLKNIECVQTYEKYPSQPVKLLGNFQLEDVDEALRLKRSAAPPLEWVGCPRLVYELKLTCKIISLADRFVAWPVGSNGTLLQTILYSQFGQGTCFGVMHMVNI
jgi:sacsin